MSRKEMSRENKQGSKWNEGPGCRESDGEQVNPLYYPDRGQTCSDSLYKFLSEYDEHVGLFFFTIMTASRMDDVAAIAQRALDKVKGIETTKEEYQRKRPSFEVVRYYSSQISQNLVLETANSFLNYLSNVVQAAIKKRHEVLRSNEQVSMREVLQFAHMDDLIAYLADKKVNELSYGGLREMEKFVQDRLGVELFSDEKQRELLTVFIELRNIFTHNGGVVNALFLSRVGREAVLRYKFETGVKYHVDFDEFCRLARNAIEVALSLDKALIAKFGLPHFPFYDRLMSEREERRVRVQKELPSLVAEETPTKQQ